MKFFSCFIVFLLIVLTGCASQNSASTNSSFDEDEMVC